MRPFTSTSVSTWGRRPARGTIATAPPNASSAVRSSGLILSVTLTGEPSAGNFEACGRRAAAHCVVTLDPHCRPDPCRQGLRALRGEELVAALGYCVRAAAVVCSRHGDDPP